MGKVVVTGVFIVELDVDEARLDWGDPGLTDDQILAEAVSAVEEEWDFFACHADVTSVDGYLVP